jgi:flagella basal body P-ring formation protein FlgA
MLMWKVFAIVASLCLGAGAFGQDSIVLRTAARVDAVRAITLGDVATVTGPEASRHAGTVVADATRAKALEGGSVKVDIGAVRAALRGSDIRWGKVALSGGTCEVTLGGAKAAVAEAPKVNPGISVRDHVATRLSQQFGVPVADLKLTFDVDRSGILDVPTAGRTVAVVPNGMSDRVPLTIRVYERGVLVTEGSVRALVQVRREVMVSRGVISRGERVSDADVVEEVRWLSPTTNTARADAVVGAAARTRLERGTVVLAKDVETPAVVHKGDLIAVDSVVGGVVIRMNNARALVDGREGEEILVEQAASLAATDKANGRRGKPATVRVRVIGPGRGVVCETN